MRTKKRINESMESENNNIFHIIVILCVIGVLILLVALTCDLGKNNPDEVNFCEEQNLLYIGNSYHLDENNTFFCCHNSKSYLSYKWKMDSNRDNYKCFDRGVLE